MAEASEVPTKLIASFPNIILLVGKPAEVKLLVSSANLINSSKVFTALLGPKFLEGREISAGGSPKEISLPDDQAEAMSDLCHLLHGKSVDKFLKACDSSTILNFAITVHKYDCVEAVRMQSAAILLAHLDRFEDFDLLCNGEGMVAAYLLDHRRAFYVATGRLIGGTTLQYHDLLNQDWSAHVPPNVLYALEAKRAAAQRKVAFDLIHISTKGEFERSKVYDDEYVKHLTDGFNATYWPPDFGPLSNNTANNCTKLIKKMNGIALTKHQTVGKEDLEAFAKALSKMCQGLCLECVKSQKANLLTECEDEAHRYW